MSKDALAGLGPGLRALTVRGNQLEELPDLSPLVGLEVVNLQDNPLMCDCRLLPLRRSVHSLLITRVSPIIWRRKLSRHFGNNFAVIRKLI